MPDDQKTWILKPGDEFERIEWNYEAKHPQQLLFEKLSIGLSGYALDDVIGASVNLFINAVRQRYLDQAKALDVFDQLAGKARQRLYDELAAPQGSDHP